MYTRLAPCQVDSFWLCKVRLQLSYITTMNSKKQTLSGPFQEVRLYSVLSVCAALIAQPSLHQNMEYQARRRIFIRQEHT